MRTTEIKHPDKKVSTGAYSARVLIGGWLCISGQGPLDLATGEVRRGRIEEETRLTMSHIGKVLEAAGVSFDGVVKCTGHLSAINDFARFNEVYRGFFKSVLRTDLITMPAQARDPRCLPGVYDSVVMSAPLPLSDISIAQGSAPVLFPDFSRGPWKTNKPYFAVET